MKEQHLNRIKIIRANIKPGEIDRTCVNKLNDILLNSKDHEVRHEVHKAMWDMGIHHSGDCCHPMVNNG